MGTKTKKSIDPGLDKMKGALRGQQQANPKLGKQVRTKQTQNRKR